MQSNSKYGSKGLQYDPKYKKKVSKEVDIKLNVPTPEELRKIKAEQDKLADEF